jgi:preprotein translocase subunit SecE
LITTIKQQTKDLLAELNRVDWPSKEKVMSSTGAVVVVSVFVGAFLYGADRLISWGMSFILPHH